MKIRILLSVFALASVAQGAMTLQFASTSAVLTNLQNSLGQTNQTLVWGIIVDTTGNGFSAGQYLPGLAVSDNAVANLPNGQFLSTLSGVSDDLLVISTNLMTLSGTGDSSTGFARPTNLVSLNYVNGVSQGDAFALVWFDQTTKNGVGQTFQAGDNYGFYTRPEFVLPADAGSSVSFASLFEGADIPRPANLEFVPEPSAALLGALGALALLRRRRN
jgi:hypothetical protein